MARPHPILWLRSHERMADGILAVALTAIAVTVHVLGVGDEADVRAPSWWTVPLVVAAALPVALRRTYPIKSGLFVIAAQLIGTLLDIDGAGFLGMMIALFAMGAHSSGPRRTYAVIAISCATALLFVAGLFVGELDIGGFASSTIVLVTAFVLGDNLRRRRERADTLVERAERAEREQLLIASQHVTAERTRIARELHDVVAHSVSVMVIQAAAARRSLHSAPENAEIALSNIEETGRQTMNELRGILGVLRAELPDGAEADVDQGSRAPQPTLADLNTLIESAADLPINLNLTGSFETLAKSVTLTGYRVVQESLTNVRRHAGPVRRVDVRIDCRDECVQIEVSDDGRGAAADHLEPGYGIAGMQERVGAIGGKMHAAPKQGGGWRVQVSLPTKTEIHT